MKRLTARMAYGARARAKVLDAKCGTCGTCAPSDGDKSKCAKHAQLIIDRLADYEDTNYTPEEVIQLAGELEACQEMRAALEDKVRALKSALEADREAAR